jgi:hypothetical protein
LFFKIVCDAGGSVGGGSGSGAKDDRTAAILDHRTAAIHSAGGDVAFAPTGGYVAFAHHDGDSGRTSCIRRAHVPQ